MNEILKGQALVTFVRGCFERVHSAIGLDGFKCRLKAIV